MSIDTEPNLGALETGNKVKAASRKELRLARGDHRLRRKIGGYTLLAAAFLGLGGYAKYKLDESNRHKANQLLETRLHDYGFPFDWDKEKQMGKIDVTGGGEKIDVRCSNAANHVVGFNVVNKGPDRISFVLPGVRDLHGNNISANRVVSWEVGSPEQVGEFVGSELPAMCKEVKVDLNQSNKNG